MELNKYDKALSRMTGTQIEWLKQPRPENGYIYATDRTILLRVKQSLCNGDYKTNPMQPKNFNRCFPEADTKLLLDIHKIAEVINKLDTTEVIMKCGDCGGDGQVIWNYEDLDGDEHTMMAECPVCRGKGTVEVQAEVREQNIEINGDYFNLGKLMLLLDTIHSLGIDTVVVEHVGNYRAMRIKAEDGVDALIMPNQVCAPTGKFILKPIEE